MLRSISLEDIFEKECKHLIGNPKDLTFVLDTGSFFYEFSGTDYRVKVTNDVMRQLHSKKGLFPVCHVEYLFDILKPEKHNEMVSPYDEALILEASTIKPSKNRKKKMKKGKIGIGWSDTEQIGLALRRARMGKKTVLLSNDGDFLRIISVLRKNFSYAKENIACVSIMRYLERKHADELEGLKGSYRNDLMKKIDSMYRTIAA